MAAPITASHIDVHHVDWKAGIYAGLIAGVVFMMAEMLMVWLFLGQSPWGPPRMIAAMVLGQNVLPPPATFDIGIVTVAMMIHFVLSIIYGVIFGWIVHNMSKGTAILTGAGLGLLIYLINFYPIAAVLFPWFAMARNWVSIVSHILFGAILTWSYVAIVNRKHS
jgi:uncharacterized membrane protein YagU involved in acid resistance